MTVTANREGDEIKLVYNLVEGRLIEVDGERILSEEEKAAATADDDPAVAVPAMIRSLHYAEILGRDYL